MPARFSFRKPAAEMPPRPDAGDGTAPLVLLIISEIPPFRYCGNVKKS